jgi:putative membrane protein
MKFFKELTGAVVAASVMTAASLAQQPPRPDAEPRTPSRDQQGPVGKAIDRTGEAIKEVGEAIGEAFTSDSPGFTDRLFVQAAQEGNQFEIATSQLAKERASSNEVREFASQMIEDHRRLQSDLSRQPRGGTEASTRRDINPAPQPRATNPDRPLPGAGIAQREATDAGNQAAISRLSPTKRAEYEILASKTGSEFDTCYLKQQVAAHKCAIGLFETQAEKGQDESLRVLAQATLPDLQRHLAKAQQLLGPEGEDRVGATDPSQARPERDSEPAPRNVNPGTRPAPTR